MGASYESLISVDEIGDRIAQSILKFFSEEKNIAIIKRLKEAELNFEIDAAELVGRTDLLKGKIFVVSGVFQTYSRDEIKSLIEKNGGKNASSISTKTDYVLAGENMGPAKLEKAKSLNIPIISEFDFAEMIK